MRSEESCTLGKRGGGSVLSSLPPLVSPRFCYFFLNFSPALYYLNAWNRLRFCSHLVSLGTTLWALIWRPVNTPLSPVPTPQFKHGVDFVLGHWNGHHVSVCTHFLLVWRQSTALLLTMLFFQNGLTSQAKLSKKVHSCISSTQGVSTTDNILFHYSGNVSVNSP